MEQLGCHWTDFHEISYLIIFWKSVSKVQVSLKSCKNNGHFTWRPIHICVISSSIILRMRNVSYSSVEKIKTHILYSITLIFLNHAIYEIRWKYTKELGRPKMKIWCMRIANTIPRATNRLSEYVILTAFPLQQWLHERASTLCYTYTACLVPYFTSTVTTVPLQDAQFHFAQSLTQTWHLGNVNHLKSGIIFPQWNLLT
jgi:hypothetical protein